MYAWRLQVERLNRFLYKYVWAVHLFMHVQESLIYNNKNYVGKVTERYACRVLLHEATCVGMVIVLLDSCSPK
jgi:hypothetical protein